MHGKPANDVAIELHSLDPNGSWLLVNQTRTNADGRTDQPLLSGNVMGVAQAQPPFLDVVPLCFTIATRLVTTTCLCWQIAVRRNDGASH